jgi:hypothetical protein
MARTVVVPLAAVANGSALEAPTTIDATLVTNGVTVNAAKPERLLLRVNNTAAGPKNVIVRGGDNPPALAAGQGDLTVSVTNATTRYLGPFESGRFLHRVDDSGAVKTGSLFVDFEAGTTGTIQVVELPAAT